MYRILNRKDRILGCLLAGALGDSIGAQFEGGHRLDAFELPSTLAVSDDTQMTLATCESIIESGAPGPDSIANAFARWHRERRFTGVGASTLKALTELCAGGHWALVGATGEYSAGNGAAMRIAPVAFFLNPDFAEDRQTIRDICRITHRNDEAYVGALAIVRTLRHVCQGHCLSDLFESDMINSLPDSRVRDRLIDVANANLSVGTYTDRYNSTGYVVDSVPLAILAATQATDLMDSIGEIAQLGGDTDTISSMFGQIYGATHGPKILPKEIVARIDDYVLIQKTAAGLADESIAK